jgi:hypothetical protein
MATYYKNVISWETMLATTFSFLAEECVVKKGVIVFTPLIAQSADDQIISVSADLVFQSAMSVNEWSEEIDKWHKTADVELFYAAR